MNSVQLVGIMANEPEVKETQGGNKVCNFSVAVKRRTPDENGNKSDFIRCVAWRQNADFLHKFIHKGYRIAINGFLTTKVYTPDDGVKRHMTEVVVNTVESCQPKGENASQAPSTPSSDDFREVNDDELPF